MPHFLEKLPRDDRDKETLHGVLPGTDFRLSTLRFANGRQRGADFRLVEAHDFAVGGSANDGRDFIANPGTEKASDATPIAQKGFKAQGHPF